MTDIPGTGKLNPPNPPKEEENKTNENIVVFNAEMLNKNQRPSILKSIFEFIKRLGKETDTFIKRY